MSTNFSLPVIQHLDLVTTKCPLNFVKTKLALEKLSPGEILSVAVDAQGQSVLNIPNSIRQEGHTILQEHTVDGVLTLWIQRSNNPLP